MKTKAKKTKQLPKASHLLDLRNALANLAEIQGCAFSTGDLGEYYLNTDKGALIFAPYSVWQSPTLVQSFITQARESSWLLVLIKDPADPSPPPYADPHLLILELPIPENQLKAQLNWLLKAEGLILEGEGNVKKQAQANDSVKQLLSLSRELNGVRDIDKLLGLILLRLRELTQADAGSIYMVSHPNPENREGVITFKISQNDSIRQNLNTFTLPLSKSSIVGSVAIDAKPLNIIDLHSWDSELLGIKHDKSWDRKIGYQARSMLTLPIFDISHTVIGVVQLINRKKNAQSKLETQEQFDQWVYAFDAQTLEFAEIVAQQAGIALENAILTQEKEHLFEGFVNASVTAIEQRDPTTSGHSHRVAHLSVEMAKMVNICDTGIYSPLRFNDQELKELEFASLLHDFGKLGVRERVLQKAKKLEPLEFALLEQRFELIRAYFEIEFYSEALKFYENPEDFPPGFSPEGLRVKYTQKAREIEEFMNFIRKANEPTVLEQGGFDLLHVIAKKTYKNNIKLENPFITNDELMTLAVKRGSLTGDEYREMQSHVVHTFEFLRQIPWGRGFANLAQIAGKHHEKLDGSGYPLGVRAQDIPTQSRIITIADIFDALTSADRPYKKAVPLVKALDILADEAKSGKIDQDLWKIFLDSKVYQKLVPA